MHRVIPIRKNVYVESPQLRYVTRLAHLGLAFSLGVLFTLWLT